MNIESNIASILSRSEEVTFELPLSSLLTVFTVAEYQADHKQILKKVGLEASHDGWLSFLGERLAGVVWTPLRYPFNDLKRALINRACLMTLIDERIEFDDIDEDGAQTALTLLTNISRKTAKILQVPGNLLIGTVSMPPRVSSEEPQFEILDEPEVPVRVVVCAANRYGELIICSARHHDEVMNSQIKAAGVKGASTEQGFVDQWGKFMSRKEALDVATAAGQINVRRPKHPGDWLCSEDLY